MLAHALRLSPKLWRGCGRPRYARTMGLRATATLVVLVWSAAPAWAGKNIVEVGGGLDAAFNDVGPLPDTTTEAGRKRPASSLSGPATHGFLFARYKRVGLFHPNVGLTLDYNTDTLSADLSAWNVGLPGLSVGVFARAEALLSNVNVNWIQDGVNKRERGFGASYGLLGGRVAYTVLQHLSFEFELGGRAWLFNRMPGVTAKDLRLPTPFVAAEPRARLKWEGLTSDGHRLGLYTGLRGMLEVAADVRALNHPFGGFSNGAVESRNNLAAGEVPHRLTASGFAGMRFFRLWWLQAHGVMGYGQNEDDLSRARVGGQNPYTVTMPGAAWGEFVCERYAATSIYLGVRPMPLIYTAVGMHAAVINDPHRVGDLDEIGLLRGISAEVRMGFLGWGVIKFQVGGNADVMRPHGRGAMGAFVWLEVGNPV